ncbi:Ragulator complex protein LAMTOR2 [Amphibalanus amphitrite]|uniref:Ragulator complex protein LAMTOR2 n=1 Tax=Amphibalanus amphitrite TaxID=1232801 RepID=A0A6A4VJB7_AMPAM|nr:Ragulator complex protein LAMTOR2 [Amphibalanus amphitrite]
MRGRQCPCEAGGAPARLMNLEGAPLAYSGGGSEQQCDVVAAIASNIWAAGTKHGLTVFDDQLALQLFDCEVHRNGILPVGVLPILSGDGEWQRAS